MFRYSLILILLLSSSLSAGITLNYPPLLPVHYSSELLIDVQESLPMLKLSSKSRQILKYTIVLEKNQYNFILTFNDIFVDLNMNQEQYVYDPKAEHAVLPLMQFARLLHQPLHLSINKKHQITDPDHMLQRIVEITPLLKQIDLFRFIEGTLQHLFFPLGRTLEIGKEIPFNDFTGEKDPFNKSLVCCVKELSDQEIVAEINGSYQGNSFDLLSSIQLDTQDITAITMTTSGTFHGTSQWKKANALLFTHKGEYCLKAKLKAGETEWELDMKITQKITSAH